MDSPATAPRPQAPRRPLVYASTPALEVARQLLPPGRCLEVEVAEIVARAQLTRWSRDGRRKLANGRRYIHADGWSAVLSPTVGRKNPERKAWLVVEVVPR